MSNLEEVDQEVPNADALAETENENQGHDFNENLSPGTVQGVLESKGESSRRHVEPKSSVTHGRHVKSEKNGAAVRIEREKHVAGKRLEKDKILKVSGRRTVLHKVEKGAL
jgi:hypothetical protein